MFYSRGGALSVYRADKRTATALGNRGWRMERGRNKGDEDGERGGLNE